jgi:hypothetical protein
MIELITCTNTAPLPGNTIAPPLELNKSYQEVNRYTCSCGQVHIDVGLKSQHNYISCYKCKEHLPQTQVHWCHPTRFAELQNL